MSGRVGRFRRARIAFVVGWVVASCFGASALASRQETNPQAGALFEFQKRVEAYIQLQVQAAGKGADLKETHSPAEIQAREKELSAAIRAARPAAENGDIFEPVAALLKKQVRTDWGRRSVEERRALMGEVPRVMRVVANIPYPSALPLATLPPALLQELPTLPATIEYRFLGRHLILRDVSANLIVDVLENALPSSPL